jgi:alpha-tubulin suppressor-like RCC1 family protein
MGPSITALRSDGTLWKWERLGYPAIFPKAPLKLGNHSDWVAIASLFGNPVTLAGDGSLWLWRDNDMDQYRDLWIKLPRQPVFLGNVFAAEK